MMQCSCNDWAPETAKLDGPIVLAQVRNPTLTQSTAFAFKPWAYCPWCGAKLTEEVSR